jgi:hypothetical protein
MIIAPPMGTDSLGGLAARLADPEAVKKRVADLSEMEGAAKARIAESEAIEAKAKAAVAELDVKLAANEKLAAQAAVDLNTALAKAATIASRP